MAKRIRTHLTLSLPRLNKNLPATYKVPEGLYERSFDLLQEKVALLDLENNFVFANVHFCNMLDLADSNEVAKRPIRDFVSSEFQENFDSFVEIMKMSNAPVGPIEVEFICGSGNKVLTQVLMEPFGDHGKVMTHLVVRDVSNWKAIQSELMDTHFELENSARIRKGSKEGKTPLQIRERIVDED